MTKLPGWWSSQSSTCMIGYLREDSIQAIVSEYKHLGEYLAVWHIWGVEGSPKKYLVSDFPRVYDFLRLVDQMYPLAGIDPTEYSSWLGTDLEQIARSNIQEL